MLRKWLKTAYVAVIESDAGVDICVYSTKGGHVLNKFLRSFDDKPPARHFLDQIISSHYFCYVSCFFRSIGQGVLPSRDKGEMVNYGIEPTNIGLLSLGGFYIYASKSEIAAAKNCSFDLLACDLLYSPFSILHTLRSRVGRCSCALLMLKRANQVAVMIYKGDVACFGNYFELKSQLSAAVADEGSLNEFIPATEGEDFEKLQFDDLDNIAEPNSADEAEETLAFDASDGSDLDNFGTEMAIFDYLKTAIKEFYENPLYQGEFIEELYIFEHEESSQAFLTMIKSELYLTPLVQKIDLFYEIFSQSCKDLGAEIDT